MPYSTSEEALCSRNDNSPPTAKTPNAPPAPARPKARRPAHKMHCPPLELAPTYPPNAQRRKAPMVNMVALPTKSSSPARTADSSSATHAATTASSNPSATSKNPSSTTWSPPRGAATASAFLKPASSTTRTTPSQRPSCPNPTRRLRHRTPTTAPSPSATPSATANWSIPRRSCRSYHGMPPGTTATSTRRWLRSSASARRNRRSTRCPTLRETMTTPSTKASTTAPLSPRPPTRPGHFLKTYWVCLALFRRLTGPRTTQVRNQNTQKNQILAARRLRRSTKTKPAPSQKPGAGLYSILIRL